MPGFEQGQFVKNIGFIIVTLIGLSIAIFIVGLLFLISKKVPLVLKVYNIIKNILFFGVLLSYFSKSFLKLYINAL